MVVVDPRCYHPSQKVFCAVRAIQGKTYAEIVAAFRVQVQGVPVYTNPPPLNI